MARVREERYGEIHGLAQAALAIDAIATAQGLLELPDKFERIASRYYRVRGRNDWGAFGVLACEEVVQIPIDLGVEATGRVDLVTEHHEPHGTVYKLWEHKSVSYVPPQARRLTDLQTLLMARVVEDSYNVHISEIVWNYLRTREPTIPRLLKDGTLTKRSDLDTTWEAYSNEIARYELNLDDYSDVRERLAGREETDYFVRCYLPLVQQDQILLRDYVASAQAVKAIYTSGVAVNAVRTIGRHCDWCPYRSLCEAVITGGDDAELKQRLYTRARMTRRLYGNGKPTTDFDALLEAEAYNSAAD